MEILDLDVLTFGEVAKSVDELWSDGKRVPCSTSFESGLEFAFTGNFDSIIGKAARIFCTRHTVFILTFEKAAMHDAVVVREHGVLLGDEDEIVDTLSITVDWFPPQQIEDTDTYFTQNRRLEERSRRK